MTKEADKKKDEKEKPAAPAAAAAQPTQQSVPSVAESAAHFKPIGLTVHTHNITQVGDTLGKTD